MEKDNLNFTEVEATNSELGQLKKRNIIVKIIASVFLLNISIIIFIFVENIYLLVALLGLIGVSAFFIFKLINRFFKTNIKLKRIYTGLITEKYEVSSGNQGQNKHISYKIKLDGVVFNVEYRYYSQLTVGQKVEIHQLGNLILNIKLL